MVSRRVTIALVACASLAVLPFAAVSVLVVKAPAIASHIASHALPSLSKQLGYEIRIGKVDARILPRPHAEVTDLVVVGAPGEPPLLSAKRGYANVALWPLLKSFGREVRVSSAGVEGAAVSIVTRADGSSNLAKLASLGSGRSWEMDRVTVRSARLDWFDLRRSDKPIAMVEAFEADVVPDGARATLRARGRLAAEAPNLDVTLSLGDAVRGTFSASRVDIARLGAALPGRMGRIVRGGQLAVQGEIATDPKGLVAVTGKGSVADLLVSSDRAQATFGVRTTLDLRPSQPPVVELDPFETGRFVLGRIETREVRGRATLAVDALRLEPITAKLAGGTLSVAAARLDLVKSQAPWTLRGALDDANVVELGRALGAKMPVSGRCSASFDVTGAGLDWDTVAPSLLGSGRFSMEGASVNAETTSAIGRPFKAGLDAFGLGALFPDLGAMSLAPFGAPFHVATGAVRLDEPVALRTQLGDAVLKGTIGLDQRLALSGTATLRFSPIPGAKAHTATVPIAVTGTLSSPVVEVTATPAQLMGAIAGAAPSAAEIQAEVRRRLRAWLDPKKR